VSCVIGGGEMQTSQGVRGTIVSDILNGSWHTCEWVMSHMRMSPVTCMNESFHTYERAMSGCHICKSHVTKIFRWCP